jgi:hypothetical protein
MFWGALMFGLVFLFIAGPTRVFIVGLCSQAVESLDAWAPASYIVLGVLGAILIGSMLILKTWPQRENTGNPMSKYRREIRYED